MLLSATNVPVSTILTLDSSLTFLAWITATANTYKGSTLCQYSKHIIFTHVNLFDPQNSVSEEGLWVLPLNKWNIWSTDSLSNFPRTTQLISKRTGIEHKHSGPRVHVLNPHSILSSHSLLLHPESQPWPSSSDQQLQLTLWCRSVCIGSFSWENDSAFIYNYQFIKTTENSKCVTVYYGKQSATFKLYSPA